MRVGLDDIFGVVQGVCQLLLVAGGESNYIITNPHKGSAILLHNTSVECDVTRA